MKKQFCCSHSQDLYNDYYVRQSGSGVGAFTGSRVQRGHGIGSIFGSLFRSAAPLLKRGLAYVGRQALKTGAQIASDMVDGKSFGESAKEHLRERIKDAAQDVLGQTGSGKRRRRIVRRVTKKKQYRRKRAKLDILD